MAAGQAASEVSVLLARCLAEFLSRWSPNPLTRLGSILFYLNTAPVAALRYCRFCRVNPRAPRKLHPPIFSGHFESSRAGRMSLELTPPGSTGD